MNEYQERALEIVERLSDDKKITIRERGTLRRAILLKPCEEERDHIEAEKARIESFREGGT